MTNMTGSFDASQFAPRQGGEGHSVGMYPFTITDTKIVSTKDNTGGMFVVEFTSPNGSISSRYNIWNNSAKAVEIAHGQLSALCHATGVFKLDWQNEGAALRGARGQMKIDYQKGEEPTPEKPTGGYVEIKKVYDVNGNEPGKAPQAAPQPSQRVPWTGPSTAPLRPETAPAASAAPSWGNGVQGAPAQQSGDWQGGPGQTHTTPQQAPVDVKPPWSR